MTDTCPSLGTLTINALTAADEVIIAVNPQLLAMMGLQDFIRTVKKVRSTVKVGESIYYSEPLLEYAPENKACKAYRNLAEEVAGDES